MAVPFRGGGGGKRLAIKKKFIFFVCFFIYKKKVPTAIMLEGVGGKAIMALPLKKKCGLGRMTVIYA